MLNDFVFTFSVMIVDVFECQLKYKYFLIYLNVFFKAKYKNEGIFTVNKV